MTKNSVLDWDVSPINNSDISGINISEGCAASGINDAIRSIMAQFAIWLSGANSPLLKSGGSITGALTNLGSMSSVLDSGGTPRGIGYRSIPLSLKSSTYTFTLADAGQGVSTSAGVTVPANSISAFATGDAVVIYNSSASSITISQGTGVTLRLAGSSTTGNRTLAQRGLATLLKVGTDEWVVSGTGIS